MGRKDKAIYPDEIQSLSLGARMRLARQSKNIALTTMAERLHYTKNYLSNVENGKRSPSFELLGRYERELELEKGALTVLLQKDVMKAQDDYQGDISNEEPAFVLKNEIAQNQDWGQAPEARSFYGRNEQLEDLKRWIVDERCCIVTILGLGGVGKTSLAVKIANEVEPYFDYVFWRSLQSIPQLTHVLEKCILLISDQKEAILPSNIDDQIELLFKYLRKSRCLLILDNFESLLQEGLRPGQYRPEYDSYARLLHRVGVSKHNSCLLLTSREKPREIPPLEGKTVPVHSMQLTGLRQNEGRMLLEREDDKLFGSDDSWERLIDRYAGNPLALKLISTSIREFFEGDIAAFLEKGDTVFGDVQDLIDEQFLRLSEHEQAIMYWLAIEQEAVTIATLLENIYPPVTMAIVQEALEALRRRSMIEKASTSSFYLLPVIKEYVLEKFVTRARLDIDTENFTTLRCYALMKAQSKEYLRNSQTQRILHPLAAYLLDTKGKDNSKETLNRMLFRLRKKGVEVPSYAVGNIINLLIQLNINLYGYDFSRMAVRQAYLQGVELQNVNFSGSDLQYSVFTKTFGSARSIALSPDGKLLAAGTTNGAIRLWLIYEGKPFRTYLGHTDWVTTVAFSPDGRWLASGSDDQTIRIWEVATGEPHEVLNGHSDWIRSVTFSPDGQWLASGSDDKIVYLWRLRSSGYPEVLCQHDSRVYSVAFSSDGELLASGSEDHMVRIWQVRTGQCLYTLQGHRSRVYSVAFSADKHLLFSGSDDQDIRVWQVSTGKLHTTISGHTGWVRSIAVSKDGELLASSSEDSTVRLWLAKTGQSVRVLQGHHSNVYSIAFSESGEFLISGSDDQSVRLWDVNTGQCIRMLQGYSSRVYSIFFSPNGQWLASGGDDQQIRLWNVNTGECFKTFQGYSTWRYSLAFSPDSQLLASGSDDQKIYIWRVKTGEYYKMLQGHNNWVRAVAFSPDGELLATGVDDQTVCIWQISTGECLQILSGHKNWIRSVAFSSDGELLASASNDRTICLWSVKTGTRLRVLEGHESTVYSVAFSPHDDRLASSSGDHTIRFWRASTGECLQVLKEHTNSVWSVSFSPDGKLLISGSEDQTIRLWRVSTGECIWKRQGHNDLLQSVTFSPYNNLAASSDYQGIIKFWNVESGECVKTLSTPRPYEGLNITRAKGLTDVQKGMLKELGAVEDADKI